MSSQQIEILRYTSLPSSEIPGINYTSFPRSDVLTHVHVCQYTFLSMVLTRRQRESERKDSSGAKQLWRTLTINFVLVHVRRRRRRLFDTLSLPCLNK